MTAVAPADADPGEPPLRISVCRDPGAFAALAAEWTRLHRRCATATAFQSHAWLHSWWLSYGPRRGRLRIVLVRRGTELVGAAALMRLYRPLPVLVALGGGITDFTDVLIDRDHADEVTDALVTGLRRAGRGAVIDLREVRPGGAAERVYERWPGPKRRLADSVCLELPGLPMADLIARVGSSRGQRIRSHLRKMDAAGVEEREVAAHEVPSAVRTMLGLHLSQWQGRGVTAEHLRPRFGEHLVRAGSRMVAGGDAVITEFRIGGEVVAANLTVLSPGLAGGYLYGAHPRLRAARVDVSTLLLRHGVRQAAGGGRGTLSLLRGAEPYKFHWRPERRVNQRLLLANRSGVVRLLVRRGLAAVREAAGRSPRLYRARAYVRKTYARRSQDVREA
ncbi:GNAT family N-acetyltransferase [Streptomyces sp.]|uniref:GNAT family N-acetyltransferase n=1 Tax=Streptomyces sp. TaxID=1931 RepID=UPI002F3E9787